MKKFTPFVVISIITTILVLMMGNAVLSSYTLPVIAIVLCHFFICICCFIVCNQYNFNVLSPITLTIALYYMILVFTPLCNMVNNNVTLFGTNTMNGCVKGTVIFIVGFTFLLFGYLNRFSFGYEIQYESNSEMNIPQYNETQLLIYCYLVWGGAIISYLIYNISIGRDLLYMLSFGFLSRGLKEVSGFNIDFMSMIVYCSFYPLLIIWYFDKSRLRKLLCLYITCVPIATRGFRSVLMIPIMGLIIFKYVHERKTPKISQLLFGLLVFIIVFGAIGSTRSSLRVGNGASLEGFAYMDGVDGIMDYFGSYKTFYGAVVQYPENYQYTFGRQLLYTFTMYIPRALWPGKPNSLIQEVIGNSTNEVARSAGAAWPNIGEYYTDGGWIGVAIIMLILGIMLRKMDSLRERIDIPSQILYALLVPALVPIITYGYTAGNLPGLVFIVLPAIGQHYFVSKYYIQLDSYYE